MIGRAPSKKLPEERVPRSSDPKPLACSNPRRRRGLHENLPNGRGRVTATHCVPWSSDPNCRFLRSLFLSLSPFFLRSPPVQAHQSWHKLRRLGWFTVSGCQHLSSPRLLFSSDRRRCQPCNKLRHCRPPCPTSSSLIVIPAMPHFSRDFRVSVISKLKSMATLGNISRSGCFRSTEGMRLIITTVVGIVIGYSIGVSIHMHYSPLGTTMSCVGGKKNSGIRTQTSLGHAWDSTNNQKKDNSSSDSTVDISKIYVPTNPRGAERLPKGIVEAESDFYLRRLWGNPNEDVVIRQKYLVAFAVGYGQKDNIDAAVKKFSENFTILLFHYDGRTSEWDKIEWSKRAIHVSVRKQTKWWYAKRFLHPDVVAAYEYIFIWDEDLGLQHFDAEEYIKLIKKHGLEISQPALGQDKGLSWRMTQRRDDHEVHKETEERQGQCKDPHLPPCAAFVEIMATVFSRDAWRCVWHMLQNDLVHGWGLDFAFGKCVEPANEKIGVVDAQWIVHEQVHSLGNQRHAVDHKAPWGGVRKRCDMEWKKFRERLACAERAYYTEKGINTPDTSIPYI